MLQIQTIGQVLVEAFSWASVPQSVHRVLAHSAERIRSNGGHGLGFYSYYKEGLEIRIRLDGSTPMEAAEGRHWGRIVEELGKDFAGA